MRLGKAVFCGARRYSATRSDVKHVADSPLQKSERGACTQAIASPFIMHPCMNACVSTDSDTLESYVFEERLWLPHSEILCGESEIKSLRTHKCLP